MTAIGQSCQSVAVSLSAHHLQPGRLIVKHGLQPAYRRIHGHGQLPKFRHLGLCNRHKAALGDGVGLANHGIQWTAQAAQYQRTQVAANQARQGQGHHHFIGTFPECAVSKTAVAGQRHAPHLLPAIADLGMTRCGLDREHPGEPVGRVGLAA